MKTADFVIGDVYRLVHRSHTQRYSRVSVMSFLGGDTQYGQWSARPQFGTVTLDWGWIESASRVDNMTKLFFGRDARLEPVVNVVTTELGPEAIRRRRFLVRMLQLAGEVSEPETWPEAVRRALQYCASVYPKVTAADFERIRRMTVEDLYGGKHHNKEAQP